MKAKTFIIASVIVLLVWLFILSRPEISQKVKAWATAIVTVSPIPPIP